MYAYNPANFTVFRCTGGICKYTQGVGMNTAEDCFRSYDAAGEVIDNMINCGSGGSRWKQVYSVKGSINTSDKNLKKNMKKIDSKKLQLLLNIIPKEYMLKDGDRIHTGLIAQEVEDEMLKLGLTYSDVGALCKDFMYNSNEENEDTVKLDSDGNPVYRYGFRYEELITPILALVQILWKHVFGDLSIQR